MKAWAVTKNKDKDKVEVYAWRAYCDLALGFPEDPAIHVHFGGGIYAPVELGLATHFCYETNSKKDKRIGFFVRPSHRNQVTPPSDKMHDLDNLPEDWDDDEEEE
jgi:hypothetical protein